MGFSFILTLNLPFVSRSLVPDINYNKLGTRQIFKLESRVESSEIFKIFSAIFLIFHIF